MSGLFVAIMSIVGFISLFILVVWKQKYERNNITITVGNALFIIIFGTIGAPIFSLFFSLY